MKKNFLMYNFAILMAVSFLFVACNNDDDDTQPQPQSIVEIAAADAQFSTLVDALTRVNLVSVLEGAGPFTVFAPTNAAFEALGVDLSTISDEDLTEILLYHVLGGAEITSGQIAEGQTYVTTAATTGPNDNQLSMLIEKAGTAVTINGDISVSTPDVDATNGVIHIVNKVIMPLDVVGHAAANSAFTSLVGALGAADGDLVNVLKGDGPFTVFAPVDDAFAAIQSTVDGLTTEQLAKVLTYHVVAGANVRSTDLTNGQVVSTVNTPTTFTVNLGNEVTITDANGDESTVVLTDVQATNGVIHVLNKVIIPNNL
ncbi:MAG: fasciclin domain-containing protein [Saprospiraceae bacterium]|nr:fasciclin domain-containing protein [Saprospiraceae bacterium]